MSKTNSYHHIVISTYCRKKTITELHKKDLYAYILGILNNKKCKLIRINGTGNHIHILLNLNPTIALSDIVKTVKQSTSLWLKKLRVFSSFWEVGKRIFRIFRLPRKCWRGTELHNKSGNTSLISKIWRWVKRVVHTSRDWSQRYLSGLRFSISDADDGVGHLFPQLSRPYGLLKAGGSYLQSLRDCFT